MTKYEISAYVEGVKKSKVVFAKNLDEATQMGWELFEDDICVREVD